MSHQGRCSSTAELLKARRDDNIRILCSGDFSDFTIYCQDHEFKVHRAVVMGKSEYFDQLINGPFKETKEQIARLNHEEPAILALAIFFIYTDTYLGSRDDIWSSDLHDTMTTFAPCTTGILPNQFLIHAKMIDIGDRLLLRNLVPLAVRNLNTVLDANLDARSFSTLITNEDFRQTVGLLCQDAKPLEHMVKVLAFKVMVQTLGAFGSGFLQDEVWETVCVGLFEQLGESAAKLGFALAKECIFWNYHMDRSCYTCDEQRDTFAAHYYLLEEEARVPSEALTWKQCVCRFRGLCSPECRRQNKSFESKFTYCEVCVESELTFRCGAQIDRNGHVREIEGDGNEFHYASGIHSSLRKGKGMLSRRINFDA